MTARRLRASACASRKRSMFGKRANPGLSVEPPPPASAAPLAPRPDAPKPPAGAEPPPPAQAERRSDSYFQTKSMIFGALIEAIDLAALSKLDPESAREEIRDIVHEIVDDQEPRACRSPSRKTCSTTSATTCSASGRSSRCCRATTSPTSWSMARRAASSKSAARSN